MEGRKAIISRGQADRLGGVLPRSDQKLVAEVTVSFEDVVLIQVQPNTCAVVAILDPEGIITPNVSLEVADE